MSFEVSNLNVFAHRVKGKSVVTIATYKTDDSLADVEAAGYFDEVSQDFQTGDVVHVYSTAASNAGGWRSYQMTVTSGDIVLAVQNAQTMVLNVQVDDVTSAATRYIPVPFAGTVTAIHTSIDTAISGGDLVVTGKIGGTDITGGAVTVANSGSAAGDVDTASPTAANIVAAGGAVELEFDGGPTAGGGAVATIVIQPSN